MKDWYEISGAGNKSQKVDKDFKRHLIKNNAIISIIGNTGSGKTTALVDLLERMGPKFYRIIIFSGATTDEPLLNFLREKIDGIEMIDDVDKLPELKDLDEENKNEPKLIVFDDFINLKAKEKVKIQKWFNSARKFGFTQVSMCQRYSDMPIQMRNNTQYFMLFRLNDMNSINQILRTHNNCGDNVGLVKQAYFDSTSQPKNFFTIDLTPGSPYRYRHNFTDIIRIK
jgi:energy-coupling factor transporter ATP-binding protein EcfA2